MASTADSMEDDQWYTIDEAISAIGTGPFQYKLLFLTGFIWAADAMEMMLLSFLIPKLKEDWNLEQPEDGLVGFVVFAGHLVGTITFSILSDRIGRRKVVIICNILCALFGLLTGIAPNIILLLLFRFGVGFSIGGAAVSYVLFAEYAPKELRGSLLIIEQGFWSVGALFSVFLAWISLEYLDWRWYLILSSVPLWIVSMFWKWIPESSRWLLASGKYYQAQSMLRRLAKENNGTLPPGRLKSIHLNYMHLDKLKSNSTETGNNPQQSPELSTNNTKHDTNNNTANNTANNQINKKRGNHRSVSTASDVNITDIASLDDPRIDDEIVSEFETPEIKLERGHIKDAFVPAYRKTTILLLVAFFLCVFGYYGISFISERYFESSKSNNDKSDEYWEMAITTASEIPGLVLGSIFLDKMGRKQCMVVCFGVYTVCAFCLTFEIVQLSRTFGIIFMFMGRMTVSLGFLILYVYYSEYYPTVIRTTTLGFASSMGRIAGMFTSFVSEDLSLTVGMLLYGIGGLISTICVVCLDQDTTGMDMATEINNKKEVEKVKKVKKSGHVELQHDENESENPKGLAYDMSTIEMEQIDQKTNKNTNNDNETDEITTNDETENNTEIATNDNTTNDTANDATNDTGTNDTTNDTNDKMNSIGSDNGSSPELGMVSTDDTEKRQNKPLISD